MAKRVPALTAAQVAAAKPGVELIDGQVPGLRLRVGPNGVRMWSLSCRDAKGERRRFDVGGGIGLAEARRKAQDLRRQVREGADPVAERRAARERARAAKEGIGTLGSVIEAYFATGPGAALRTRGDQEKHLRRVFVKQLTSSAGDMTAAALQLVIDRYPTKVSAARAVAYLTPVTKWAAKRGLMGGRIELEKPAVGDDDAEDNGQRVLTPDELKAILPCLDDAHGRCARFLLLTGVRLREATGATWVEFDLDAGTWTIPPARRKDTRSRIRRKQVPTPPLVIPLPRQAVALLREARAAEVARRARVAEPKTPPEPIAAGDLALPGARGCPLANWHRWLKLLAKRTGVEGWSCHALRRTAATLLGELGVPPHVVEAVLGHRGIGGALHAGYNQAKYRREHGEALQRLADLIDDIEAGRSNVVPLHRAAAE